MTNFCMSWSGGKDACFALWQAMGQGLTPACLLTMLTAGQQRTAAHGLRREVLEAQARCMGLPIVFGHAEPDYEHGLKAALDRARESFDSQHLLFGDIDLQAHRDWYEAVLTDITLGFPLWHYPRSALLTDLFAAGFETMIVSVKGDTLDRRLLGKVLTCDIAAQIADQGVCPTGEDGEFHTLVINAPHFQHRLAVDVVGTIADQWGYTQLDLVAV